MIQIQIAFISVFVLYGQGAWASTGLCAVGDWSDWTECQTAKYCAWRASSQTPVTESWSLPASHSDQGRAHMDWQMNTKQHLHDDIGQCKNNGSCPELLLHPSRSYHRCMDGLAGDIPCRNIDMLSFVNFADLGYATPLPGDTNPSGNDIWGWTDPVTGDEYAIMGLTGGTSFVRITDPIHPLTVAFLETHTFDPRGAMWRDIKVIGHYAFIVSEIIHHGMQIFDLHHLRGQSHFSQVQADAHYDGVGSAHNVVANEETDYVYLVGATPNTGNYTICDGGLHAVDVSEPLKPRFAGCFSDDGYTHDAQCVVYRGPDKRYTGREICICFNLDSVTIVDVTAKDSMKMISKRTYEGALYSHQGMMTEDFTTLVMGDEQDEVFGRDQHTKTLIWDVRDLTKPTLKDLYVSSDTSIDHNQYIVGNFTFQANYQAGLRILHINVDLPSNNYDLLELAYFDVYPADTVADFMGSWSVYPYFPSGNVVISSIDYGLYVVRPNYREIQAHLKSAPVGERKRMRQIVFAEDNPQCPPLVETQRCYPDIVCRYSRNN